MSELPDDLEPYRTVGPFTAETVPTALTRSHATKAGVWGRIKVSAGSLVLARYDGAGTVIAEETISAGQTGFVAPGEAHHVTLSEAAEFQVTFMRRQTD